MKYIYTFWSKPLLEKPPHKDLSQKKQDLLQSLYYYSFSLLKKTNAVDIELVTDDFGASMFKHIPYSNVRLDLNKLNNFSSRLWSLAQAFALSLYDEPIASIDGDFMIKDAQKFKEIIDSPWDVLIQSKEISPSYTFNYQESLKNLILLLNEDILNKMPEFMYFDSYNYTTNVGFMGFKNLNFKNEYANKLMCLFNYFNEEDRLKTFDRNCGLFSKRHECLHNTHLVVNLMQNYLTLLSNYKNIYVKELSPISEWEMYNGINGKMNNYQNACSIYTHYLSADKYKFPQDKPIYDKIINS